ncbi:MAG: hypothetical protein ACHQHP_05130 [Bacteroidia bacterium]
MWLKGNPPKKDYYAVIFASTKEDDLTGYYELDDKLMELAQQEPGFLGWENVKNGNQSIFISYCCLFCRLHIVDRSCFFLCQRIPLFNFFAKY